jgi:hypothetical protein
MELVQALKTWSATYFDEAGVGLATASIAEKYDVSLAKARRLARSAGLKPGLYSRNGVTICPGEPGWPRNGHKPGWMAVWEPPVPPAAE